MLHLKNLIQLEKQFDSVDTLAESVQFSAYFQSTIQFSAFRAEAELVHVGFL
jgi:hypothetical protein